MLPLPIFNFENLKNLDTIIEVERVQKRVTYFYIQPLCVYRKHLAYDEKIVKKLRFNKRVYKLKRGEEKEKPSPKRHRV